MQQNRSRGNVYGRALGPKLSVVVGTFFLVSDDFLGEGTGVIRYKYDGPGVLPGRYAGEAIPISDGPTPEQVAFQEHKVAADGLAGWICAAAADAARSEYISIRASLPYIYLKRPLVPRIHPFPEEGSRSLGPFVDLLLGPAVEVRHVPHEVDRDDVVGEFTCGREPLVPSERSPGSPETSLGRGNGIDQEQPRRFPALVATPVPGFRR